MDAVQFGRRLRAARNRCGLNQQDVADRLDLPRTAITHMESGRRSVSTLELVKLAEIYGCSEAFFFTTEADVETEDLSVVLQRTLPEIKQAPEVKTAVQRLLHLYEEGAVLRRLLDQTIEHVVPDYGAHMSGVADAIRQGEKVADDERHRMGLGKAPIRDIAKLISDQGIWTAAAPLPDGMSGLFVNHPAVGLAIVVNRGHSDGRKHFSYAHEYAHALFDRDKSVTTTRRENSSELSEKRANSFAAAFLMPPAEIREQLEQIDKGHPNRYKKVIFDVAGNAPIDEDIRTKPSSQAITCQDAALLADHFGVSYEALVWRLKNLNYINQNQAPTLIQQKAVGQRHLELLGIRKGFDESGSHEKPEQELRSQILRLAIEAFRQEEISRGRLVEIGKEFSVDGDVLLELTAATCFE